MDAYLKWLLDRMNYKRHGKGKYGRLMRALNEKEFTCAVLLDENRIYDALQLRKQYLDETFSKQHKIFGDDLMAYCPNMVIFGPEKCSCLEMFAALSIRCETEITGEPGRDKLERMFWIALDNLGFSKYNDEHFNRGEVDTVLEKFMDHSDNFCPFPYKKSDVDWKRIDIWYAMRLYLADNLEL